MPRFTIISADRADIRADWNASDEASVLYRVARLGGGGAHVMRDDVYAFSMRETNGVWTIFQRSG